MHYRGVSAVKAFAAVNDLIVYSALELQRRAEGEKSCHRILEKAFLE
jgi:hypothetical protein